MRRKKRSKRVKAEIEEHDFMCLKCSEATPIRVHGLCPKCADELDLLIDNVDPYRKLAVAVRARRDAVENDHSLLLTQLAAIGPALAQVAKANAILQPACQILAAISYTAHQRDLEPIER